MPTRANVMFNVDIVQVLPIAPTILAVNGFFIVSYPQEPARLVCIDLFGDGLLVDFKALSDLDVPVEQK